MMPEELTRHARGSDGQPHGGIDQRISQDDSARCPHRADDIYEPVECRSRQQGRRLTLERSEVRRDSLMESRQAKRGREAGGER
jgi:hypothetical protein